MSGDYSTAAARRSAEAIRQRIGDAEPEIALILGSGLGGLADDIENAVRVPFADIPVFPEPTVLGHRSAGVRAPWRTRGDRASGRVNVRGHR